VCEVAIEIDNAAFTVAGQNVWITGNVDVLGNWTPVSGVQLTGTPVNGNWTGTWLGTLVVPQGMNIQFKATVVDAQGNTIAWEPDFQTGSRNRELSVPTATRTTFRASWGQP
jgi:hypothetical protein